MSRIIPETTKAQLYIAKALAKGDKHQLENALYRWRGLYVGHGYLPTGTRPRMNAIARALETTANVSHELWDITLDSVLPEMASLLSTLAEALRQSDEHDLWLTLHK